MNKSSGNGSRMIFHGGLLAVALAGLGGCSEPPLLGEARVQLTQVPAMGVACIRLTVSGSRTVVKTYDVVAGQMTVLVASGLPTGNVSFLGEAFASGCGAIGMNEVPTWLSSPTPANLVQGMIVDVRVVMRRNANGNIAVDFEDDDGGMGGNDGGVAPDLAAAPDLAGCGDTQTDPNNCGACGNRCLIANGTPACALGACTIAACNANFQNCANGAADGCESNRLSDANNCGFCGNRCNLANAVSSCNVGLCGIAMCNPSFGNCDGLAANGCESNFTTDANNCGACGNACPSGVCVAGTCRDKVLLVGAVPVNYNADVQAKLVATGAFAQIDTFNAVAGTPTLVQLQAYQAVLVYSDNGFANPSGLGDTIADYFDGGGRVVTATFANTNAGNLGLAGRWIAGGYNLLALAAQDQPPEVAPLIIVDPMSPLVSGVTTLTAQGGYRSTGALVNGGVAVARWGSGSALLVAGVKNGRRHAELNFYPPSAAVQPVFWVGDGAAALRNALLYK